MLVMFRTARLSGGHPFLSRRRYDLLCLWFWQAYDRLEPIGQESKQLAFLAHILSQGRMTTEQCMPPYSEIQEILRAHNATPQGKRRGWQNLVHALTGGMDDEARKEFETVVER